MPAVVHVAFLGEGQTRHELIADVGLIVGGGTGGAVGGGAVLLVGHVVEAVRHVLERGEIGAVRVIEEHRAVRVVGLGADVLGQRADHVVGDLHVRGARIVLHVDVQTIQADGDHVLVDDLLGIGIVVGLGGLVHGLALPLDEGAEAVDRNAGIVDAAHELDAARVQVRRVVGLELVVERLSLLLLALRHVAEDVHHVHAVGDVVHRDPVVVRQVGVDALHRDVAPGTVVHHEVTVGRLRGLLRRGGGGLRVRRRCECARRRQGGRRNARGNRCRTARHGTLGNGHTSCSPCCCVLRCGFVPVIDRGRGSLPATSRRRTPSSGADAHRN